MRIIISPAKKMNRSGCDLAPETSPVFLKDAEFLMGWIRTLTEEEKRKLWNCSEAILGQTEEEFACMDLNRDPLPALVAYEGIQYQYMAPSVFTWEQFAYVQEHLRILSGFYGLLRPMDGVVPYRLEMQAKGSPGGRKNLYDYWGDRIYRELMDESGILINLASREYAKAVDKYLSAEERMITCIFGELSGGRVVQKGVYAKMARGEMVHYLAEIGAEDPEEIKGFQTGGYGYDEKRSDETTFYFLS